MEEAVTYMAGCDCHEQVVLSFGGRTQLVHLVRLMPKVDRCVNAQIQLIVHWAKGLASKFHL